MKGGSNLSLSEKKAIEKSLSIITPTRDKSGALFREGKERGGSLLHSDRVLQKRAFHVPRRY